MNRKILLFVALALAGCYLFYWYELRPAKIRHNCSWTKVTDPAILAITKETAEASKVEYDKCVEEYNKKKEEADRNGTVWDKLNFRGDACNAKLKHERTYTPEKVWYREANDKEYGFCLHEKGL